MTMAIGVVVVGRLPGDPTGDQRDGECGGIGQIVDSVGHQREAAREHAADNLGHGQEDVDRDGDSKAPVAARHVRGSRTVRVSVMETHGTDDPSA